MIHDFVVVGAGISGVTAARSLTALKKTGLVLEKSRGFGGRMSTRKIKIDPHGMAIFDHGAQFLTIRDPYTAELLRPLIESNFIHEWQTQIPHEDYPTAFKSSARFISKMGMSAVPKELAKNLRVNFETKVVRIERQAKAWSLWDENENRIDCRLLVITCPTPQITALLPEFKDHPQIKNVSYRPCLAVLICRELPFEMEWTAKWMGRESSVEWICDNQKKGISPLPALTMHFSKNSSEKYFDSPDEEVFRMLEVSLPNLHRGLNLHRGDFLYRAVHRWRYSQPIGKAIHPPYLYDQTLAPLLMVGDGFSGGRVEGAIQSTLSGLNKWQETQ